MRSRSSAGERLSLEHEFGLARGAAIGADTWSYELLDPTPKTLRALVRHPSVEDTHGFDRASPSPLAHGPNVPGRSLVVTLLLWSSAFVGFHMIRLATVRYPPERKTNGNVARSFVDIAAVGWRAAQRRRAFILNVAVWIVSVAIVGSIGWSSRSPLPSAWPGRRFGYRVTTVQTMRFTTILPADQRIFVPDNDMHQVAVSPDGTHLVYGANRQPRVRALYDDTAVPLTAIEGGRGFLFSPDGKWIALWRGGELTRVAVAGGPATVLCSAETMLGAT